MGMFFSKNRAGIASVALLLTTLMTTAMAVQTPAPEEDSLPEAPGASEKMPDDFNPMETPEQRLIEEWERLGVLPEDEGEGENPNKPSLPAKGERETSDDKTVSVRFGSKAMVIQPGFIRTTLNFDNDQKPSKPQDPANPTSEGTGPGGKHKGGSKVMQLHSIPVIKMGDNSQEHKGFKVINNPWNS